MFKNFYTRIAVSHLSNNNFTEPIVCERMARQLSEDIVKSSVKITKEDYHTTYEMNVIVATETDFFRAVAEYVQKAQTGYPMTMEELSVK